MPMSSIRQLLMKETREGGLIGHFGELNTFEILNEHLFWSHIRKDVHNISKNSPHGLYTSLLIPTTPWIGTSVDFVLGLSRPKGGRDSIFVVVDRFSKMNHFVPCHKSDDIFHVANLFFREVVMIHGLPRTIVLVKDTKFLGHFGRSLWSRLGTKLLFSTICHLQTNGQTKLRLLRVVANLQERTEEQARLTDEEEAEKSHEEEIRWAEEREARLREQLELLRSMKGHTDPPPSLVAWGQPFSEHIDGTPIPPQFRELVVDPFDGLQDPCVHLQTFQIDDLISCKLFLGTLRGVAMRWFSDLPPRSIKYFLDLVATLESQFAANREKHLEVVD
ncbi:hypothetical protein CR513_04945, partial [Mucuna pruriens]